MRRCLRKGQSSVFLQFKNDGFSIGAELFEIDAADNVITFSFSLRPVDTNQTSDEQELHSSTLQSIQIHDDYLIKQLEDYLRSDALRASKMQLVILSKGKRFRYEANVGMVRLGFLPMEVTLLSD